MYYHKTYLTLWIFILSIASVSMQSIYVSSGGDIYCNTFIPAMALVWFRSCWFKFISAYCVLYGTHPIYWRFKSGHSHSFVYETYRICIRWEVPYQLTVPVRNVACMPLYFRVNMLIFRSTSSRISALLHTRIYQREECNGPVFFFSNCHS